MVIEFLIARYNFAKDYSQKKKLNMKPYIFNL